MIPNIKPFPAVGLFFESYNACDKQRHRFDYLVDYGYNRVRHIHKVITSAIASIKLS